MTGLQRADNDKMSSPHDEQCSQVVSEMTIVPPGIFGGGSNRYVPRVSSSEFSPHIGHCLVAMFYAVRVSRTLIGSSASRRISARI